MNSANLKNFADFFLKAEIMLDSDYTTLGLLFY